MEKILGTEIGQEFIGKLNDNFAEYLSGGNGTIAVKIPLQGGELKSATGYADGRWCEAATITIGGDVPTFTYTDDNYNKYLHTPCYISLIGNSIKGITTPSDSTLSIFCYNDQFTLLDGGVVQDEDDIPDSAAYVKLQVYNSSGYANVIPLQVKFATKPQFVKNSFTPLTPQYHNFECKPPKLFDNAECTTPHTAPTGSTPDIDTTRYHDNAFVMLPPNYTHDGEPTKFIIFFAGDAVMWFMAHTPFVGKNAQGKAFSLDVMKASLEYLCNMGYAVVSCGGYTSMWGNEYGSTHPDDWNARIRPSYIASVSAFYDFLMNNYNFDQRPYTMAKSAGGYMFIYTAAKMPFPIRAAAGFSIGMNLCSSIMQTPLSWQKSWQKTLGCPDWDSFVLNATGNSSRANPNGNANEKNDADILLANKEIYRKYDPLLANCRMDDFDTYFNGLFTYNSRVDPHMELPENTSLKAVWENTHKVQPVPTKLWCATNDPAVLYGWHELYVEQVIRCGGTAELRSYTGDDGDHSTFFGNNGKTATVLTPNGTMSGVNIGIVEAVEWFKRW